MENNERLTMKSLPVSERPYEKMERLGPGALSDAELLAIILRNGTSRERVLDIAIRCLKEAGCEGEQSPFAALFSMPAGQLSRLPGIGRVKALQLKAVMEISARISRARALPNFRAEDPQSIADVYMEKMRHLPQEVFHVLFMNHQNRLLFEQDLTVGTATHTVICARDVFAAALEHRAVHVILMHNHPGGDPTPSPMDVSVTRQIFQAGQLMEIRLLDHIIIGDGVYYSMNEHRLLEESF